MNDATTARLIELAAEIVGELVRGELAKGAQLSARLRGAALAEGRAFYDALCDAVDVRL